MTSKQIGWARDLVQNFQETGQIPRQSDPESRMLNVMRREGTLDPEVVEILNIIPGIWGRPRQETQIQMAEDLRMFCERNGEMPKGSHWMGTWASRRRSDHKKGKLDPEVKQRSEAIPGWRWA